MAAVPVLYNSRAIGQIFTSVRAMLGRPGWGCRT
jgi:hypothetical protein